MSNEQPIRPLARKVLHERLMPPHDPEYTWAGAGAGLPCTICGDPITRDQVEYELHFRRHAAAIPRLTGFHLHLRCFAAWEMERTKAASDSDTP